MKLSHSLSWPLVIPWPRFNRPSRYKILPEGGETRKELAAPLSFSIRSDATRRGTTLCKNFIFVTGMVRRLLPRATITLRAYIYFARILFHHVSRARLFHIFRAMLNIKGMLLVVQILSRNNCFIEGAWFDRVTRIRLVIFY